MCLQAFCRWLERPSVNKFRLLCAFIFLLVVISAVIGVTLILLSKSRDSYSDARTSIENSQNKTQYRYTEEQYILTALPVQTTINYSVKPCENFYEFACGGWTLSNPIPDGRSTWSVFDQLEQDNQLIIKNILEDEIIVENEYEAVVKAKRYYLSCLDTNKTTENLEAQPILDLLNKIGDNLQDTLEILQNDYGFEGLFFWTVAEDDKNSSQHIIQIDQPRSTLLSIRNYADITTNTKLYDAYFNFTMTVSELLGATTNIHRITDVITFEKELAKIMLSDEVRRNRSKIYKRLNVSKLQKIAPFIQWKRFFANAFRKTNRTINDDQPVVLYAEDYLINLNALIAGSNTLNILDKKMKTLRNFLILQASRSMAKYLSKPFRKSYKKLQKLLSGSREPEENWRHCIKETNDVFGFALQALYVRHTFDVNSITVVRQMMNNIKDAFKENFDKLKWMDSSTSLEAKKKADSIITMIGFPDFILNADELNKKYDGLVINESEYFANKIRINKFKIKENLSKLDEPVNTKWLMAPSAANAFYHSPNTNKIVFPAGILRSPFLDNDRPLALNYGSIGVLMGHELTHAFDNQGRQYDKNGNLNQWWTKETIDNFENATKCLVNQYSKYNNDDKFVSEARTLEENIADYGGLKASYHAYQNLKKNVSYKFNHALDQLFFISFAQMWCTSSPSKAISSQLNTHAYASSVYRVNVLLQNLNEFSDAFGCEKNTHKCEIW